MVDRGASIAERAATLRGAAGGRALPRSEGAIGTRTATWLFVLFFVSLLVPVYFDIAGLRLSPTRVVLLAIFVPLCLRWIGGAAGRITLADILMALHCLWISLALVMVHGTDRIPFAGVTVIELFGGYLVGRTLIRSAADYAALFRYFTIALVCLAPFVLVEMLTEEPPIIAALGSVLPSFADIYHPPRAGFYRAQAVFEHPILFGLFCSVAIANLFFIHYGHLAKRLLLSAFATGMTFASLSSAPLLAALTQFGLAGWGLVTRGAWWTLFFLTAFAYVVVDLLSNRTPITILISELTFNPTSAWYRVAIWDYGIAEVWRNPIFGIGLNDWQRASWMYHSTVDNFWLVVAMRYGIPGFLLLAFAILANLRRIVSAPDLPEPVTNYRRGYVIALLGLVLTLCTVHIWGAVSVFVMCYIGAGNWFYSDRQVNGASGAPGQPITRRRPETRTSPVSSPVSGEGEGRTSRPLRATDREAVLKRRQAQYGKPRR